MKFGGTSVAGAERIRAVAAIVASRTGERPLVVTSAMAGVTNELERLVDDALAGRREPLDAGWQALQRRHQEAARALAPGDAALPGRLDDTLRDLRVLLRGLRLVGTASARARDAVLGFGELLAQELLAAALREAGVATEVVDARRIVVTDAAFGAAHPDPEASRERARGILVPLIERGTVPVLGGYLGATPEGVPTTLGRGGSDLSASFLGLILGADCVEIWTDVDGLMTADPRTVPSARLVPEVTFREAAEMAAFGARVLHPASIEPAVRGGVPVVVRNSLAPDRPGTLIGRSGGAGPAGPRAIVTRRGLSLVSVRAPELIRRTGFLPDAVSRLERSGGTLFHVTVGPVGLEAVFGEAAGLEHALAPIEGAAVAVVPDLAAVSVVGEGLARRPDLWSRVLGEAAQAARCLRVLQAPRAAALGLLVRAAEADELARALHAALIEGDAE